MEHLVTSQAAASLPWGNFSGREVPKGFPDFFHAEMSHLITSQMDKISI